MEAAATSQNFTASGSSTKRLRAAQLVAEDALSDEQIAEAVGVSRRTLATWKKTPDFAKAVADIVEKTRKALLAEGIRNKKNRLAALDERQRRLMMIVEDRAADAKASGKFYGVPGYRSGYMVYKPEFSGGKEPYHIDTYQVDTGLVSALNAVEKQAAVEMGQWSEKREVTGKDGGPLAFSIIDIIRKAAED